MALASGTRLGPYQITDQIGVGGMGEVYRARDVNLGRDVALKVLPDAFAQDSDRLARFEREAKTLAALNHPNIAIVHGFEKTGEIRALVMELVEGPTLADRIAQGPIAIDEALPIAQQIAEALETAHEQGIIHRDLKPANIKIRVDGAVKVLDFGLAKIVEASGRFATSTYAGSKEQDPAYTGSPTITTPAMTQIGVILGTAAYMAPEQARGKTVDKRTDVWAFGCVLFEMLTGTRAFDGEDATDTIAAVVRAEPKWDALSADTPAPIRLLLRRCLEKDRKKRIGDISTALFIMNEQALPAAPTTTTSATASRASWPHLAWSAVAVAVAIVGTALAVWVMTRPAAPRVSRLELNTSGASRLALYINNMRIAISGDGSRVIYPAGTQGGPPTFVSRRLDQLESTPLAERANDPFLSPDGRWLGYAVQGTIRKVAVTGGSSLEVTPIDGTNLRGATWGTDGTIVFATQSPDTGLLRVPSSGGQPQVLTRPDRAKGEGDHVLPRWLPGGNAVLFTIQNPFGPPDSATSQIAVLDLRTPRAAPKIVLRGGSDARYVSTGHLVYVAGDSLWAVPFDLDRLEVKESAPTQVLSLVASSQGIVGVFDIAGDGTLVYLPRSALASPERQLAWIDRHGKEEIIPAPARPYAYPRISPDGARVAVDIREHEVDIWTWDLARKGFTRITTDPGQDRAPLWLDNDHIIYSSMMAGNPSLFLQRADGSGAPEQLSRGAGAGQFPLSLSPDGKQVVFVMAMANGNDLMTLHLDRPAPPQANDASSSRAGSTNNPRSLREVQPLVNAPGAQTDGMISPDGRWLAYQSNESGAFDIYVRPFPDVNSGIRHTVSTNGGTQPRWASNGRELFYLDSRTNAMMSVRVEPGPTWSAGAPEKLFDASPYSVGANFPYYNYDIAKDGRFLMIKSPGGSPLEGDAAASLVVVQNWFEELKRLVTK